MEKLLAVVIIISIAIAAFMPVLAVSAENVVSNLKVSYSGIEKVTGGGGCKIPSPLDPDPENEKANFEFVVQYKDGETEPSGNLTFNDHATAPPMKVESESIDTLAISENKVTFTGTAKVDDESGYSFSVDAEDNGKQGKDNDKFEISITDPGGAPYYSASGTLKGGNIQIYDSVILFDASASYDRDPNGDIKEYRWDFGDGTPVLEGDVVKVTHSYNEEGDYTVNLTVEDNEGATDMTTITVTANEEEGGGEGEISGNVTWNGTSNFESLDDMMFIAQFQMITATAYGIINNSDSNVNVTVELRVDDVPMEQSDNVRLDPGSNDISITAMWIPTSSGAHFVSLHVRECVDDEEYWVGPTNDPTAEVKIFIVKVK